jgi:hypothetical protein
MCLIEPNKVNSPYLWMVAARVKIVDNFSLTAEFDFEDTKQVYPGLLATTNNLQIIQYGES